MVDSIFGIKKHMTSVYDYKGRRVGATVVSLPANFVTQIKTMETDGYQAVQLGTSTKKSVKKPQQGHLKKASAPESTRFLKEVRVESVDDVALGQQLKATDVLHTGDLVKVQGVSKGKGFQGGVRRHGFHGGPKTHGQSDRHRAPGSIGAGTTPGRVYKGKRMAGHMGVDTVSIKGLEIIKIDRENEEILIKGGLPGPIGGLLKITVEGQLKGYVAPEEPAEELEASSQELESSEDVEAQVDSEQLSADSNGEAVAAEETTQAVEATESESGNTPEESATEVTEEASENAEGATEEASEANEAETSEETEEGDKS